METEPQPTDEAGTEEKPGATVKPSRLSSDRFRVWTSFAISTVLGVVGLFAVLVIGARLDLLDIQTLVEAPGFTVGVYFVVWSLYCLCYAALTLIAMPRLEPATLTAMMRETQESRERRRMTEFLNLSGGPWAAVSFSVIAVAAVLLTGLDPSLRGNPFIVVMAFVVVACSWLLVVLVYANHYAREQNYLGGLRFPDDEEAPEQAEGPGYNDFLYLSVQVQTTFSTSDVEVVKRAMRRVVIGHSVVAFSFNTVIIALLVSLLIGAAG